MRLLTQSPQRSKQGEMQRLEEHQQPNATLSRVVCCEQSHACCFGSQKAESRCTAGISHRLQLRPSQVQWQVPTEQVLWECLGWQLADGFWALPDILPAFQGRQEPGCRPNPASVFLRVAALHTYCIRGIGHHVMVR